MNNFWNKIKKNPNRTMFLVPILLVAGISISHVVTWYNLSNPINWAIYLSIAIEVGAMTALVAATNKIKGGVWFMFILITIIQMIGNIFYSYNQIDENSQLFKSWIELTSPIWALFGTESNDIISLKRWLSFLEGGLLPIISLTSLHFFVNYKVEEEKDAIEIKDISNKNLKKEENKEENKEEDLLKDIILEDFKENVEDEIEDSLENSSIEEVESEIVKEDFDTFIEKKKKKLEEDRKVFIPLLDILYKKGEVSKGDIMPTYMEFMIEVDSNVFSNDNIKMFLTLCNYLEITELSDNIRKAKLDYEGAKDIMIKYLSLEESVEGDKKKDKELIEKKKPQDWWNKK